jgi:hypothetical protein
MNKKANGDQCGVTNSGDAKYLRVQVNWLIFPIIINSEDGTFNVLRPTTDTLGDNVVVSSLNR